MPSTDDVVIGLLFREGTGVMSDQEGSNGQIKGVSYYTLFIIAVSLAFAAVTVAVTFVWLSWSQNTQYLVLIVLLILSVSWLVKKQPDWSPRLSYLLVAGAFSVIGAAILCVTIEGGKEWCKTRNLEAVGVPWPIALLAAIAELLPAILWFISLWKCDWENRCIDEWISKMSIYSILWVFLLFLSAVNTATKKPTPSSVDNFMWTCLTSFLVISSLKESVNALVTLRITDNDLV